MKRALIVALLAVIMVSVYVFTKQKMADIKQNNQTSAGNFILKSSVFKQNEIIPSKFTCDGDDVNPMLEIRNAPTGTKSFALIVDDPDATRGTPWDHWILWNINPKTQYISEDNVPAGAVQGMTSFGHPKYGGPCPPKGSRPHRYIFKLYALDTELDLPEGSIKEQLVKATEGHIINQTKLIGLYQRK